MIRLQDAAAVFVGGLLALAVFGLAEIIAHWGEVL